MPQTPKSPGRDFSAALKGQKLENWTNTVFYEMETTRAIRTDRWKYVSRQPAGPFELYDMHADPQERFNQYAQPGTADIQSDLAKQLDSFFTQYADSKYDIWKGGGSKAKRHTADK